MSLKNFQRYYHISVANELIHNKSRGFHNGLVTLLISETNDDKLLKLNHISAQQI